MTGYSMLMRKASVAATENDYLFLPKAGQPVRSTGVILLHGAGSPDQYADHAKWGSHSLGPALADAGYACVAGHMANDAMGNDTAMARVTAYGDWMETQAPVVPNKYILVGTSMGGYTALRWAINNTAKTKALALILPLADIVGAYTANIGGLQASIAAAWGVVAPAALPAGADITASAAAIKTANIPGRLYYEDSDTITLPATQLAMAATIGASSVLIDPADLGHTENTVWEASKIGGVAGAWTDLITFLRSAAP